MKNRNLSVAVTALQMGRSPAGVSALDVFSQKARRNGATANCSNRINSLSAKNRTVSAQNPYRNHADPRRNSADSRRDRPPDPQPLL
jgi:hypothetical protein